MRLLVPLAACAILLVPAALASHDDESTWDAFGLYENEHGLLDGRGDDVRCRTGNGLGYQMDGACVRIPAGITRVRALLYDGLHLYNVEGIVSFARFLPPLHAREDLASAPLPCFGADFDVPAGATHIDVRFDDRAVYEHGDCPHGVATRGQLLVRAS